MRTDAPKPADGKDPRGSATAKASSPGRSKRGAADTTPERDSTLDAAREVERRSTPATFEDQAARPTPRPVVPEAEPQGGMAAAYAVRSVKTEAKNQAVRDSLEPLGPGQRPPWVTAAAVLAFGLGLLNIVLYLAGVRVEGATIGGTVFVGVILLACAAGMWMAKYSAVLAFEVLLGITAAFAALSLLVASSIGGAIRSVLVVGVCGTFFWKLIRAMARMQMPARPGEQRR